MIITASGNGKALKRKEIISKIESQVFEGVFVISNIEMHGEKTRTFCTLMKENNNYVC